MGWPGPMTDRQFHAWCAWENIDRNRPGKIEAYLMNIAAEVRRSYAANPNEVNVDDMRVEFTEPPPLMTVEEATALSKSKWSRPTQ